MKKIIITLCLFGVVAISSAQNINNYKYIIIPETYDFLEEVNKYQLNALTKYLFEEAGFTTLMTNENKPQDLAMNSCLGLTSNVKNNSGLFVTKLVIELKDCQGKLIFKSEEGRSREKDFKKAYHEALRDAFTSFENIDYEYKPLDGQADTMQNEEIEEKKEIVVTQIPAKNEVNPEQSEEENENISNESSLDEIDKNALYTYSGKNYVLKSTDQGFGLYQEASSEPIALLIATESGKNYIYNSLTNQGVAYFDAEDNLIVEYFNRQENKKMTLTYELKD